MGQVTIRGLGIVLESLECQPSRLRLNCKGTGKPQKLLDVKHYFGDSAGGLWSGGMQASEEGLVGENRPKVGEDRSEVGSGAKGKIGVRVLQKIE